MQKAPSQELILLGGKIKKIREKKLMSQSTLASMCDVDIRTIQRIEKGEYGFGNFLPMYVKAGDKEVTCEIDGKPIQTIIHHFIPRHMDKITFNFITPPTA